MKTLFFSIVILLSYNTFGQVPSKALNTQEKEFFQTLTTLTEYLKNHKTVPLRFHESLSYPEEESFYDEVINKYFEKHKTVTLFEKDTLKFAVEGKLDMIRHILNAADYFIDILPSDSIFVRKFNSEQYPNTLEVYLLSK